MDPIWIWKAYLIYEQILVWPGLVWFWTQALNKPVNVTSKVRISSPRAKVCGTVLWNMNFLFLPLTLRWIIS
jgi:hypothetical protein